MDLQQEPEEEGHGWGDGVFRAPVFLKQSLGSCLVQRALD